MKLAIAGNALLRCLSVHCRSLVELELQLAHDVTEDGLMALAGKAPAERDHGSDRLEVLCHFVF